MPVGPGDRNMSPPTRLVLDFCRGKLPMIMKCTLNLIDVRDLARGLWLVMQKGQFGRRYILGNANLTLEQLLGILSELVGVPKPQIRVPYGLALSFAWISELWADRVSRRSPKATLTGVRLARRIMHFDSSRTAAEIGLNVRPVRDSLADLVSWLSETGQLPRHATGPASCAR
jgi:dihydroflavonol-4-reductase